MLCIFCIEIRKLSVHQLNQWSKGGFQGSARSPVQNRIKTSYGRIMMISTIHNASRLLAFAKVSSRRRYEMKRTSVVIRYLYSDCRGCHAYITCQRHSVELWCLGFSNTRRKLAENLKASLSHGFSYTSCLKFEIKCYRCHLKIKKIIWVSILWKVSAVYAELESWCSCSFLFCLLCVSFLPSQY